MRIAIVAGADAAGAAGMPHRTRNTGQRFSCRACVRQAGGARGEAPKSSTVPLAGDVVDCCEQHTAEQLT